MDPPKQIKTNKQTETTRNIYKQTETFWKNINKHKHTKTNKQTNIKIQTNKHAKQVAKKEKWNQ